MQQSETAWKLLYKELLSKGVNVNQVTLIHHHLSWQPIFKAGTLLIYFSATMVM
jgi:hypothetical protein